MPPRPKIVLLHFVGQMPLAGIAWQAIHYLAGLERLGFESWYVEDGGANPYDPRENSVVMDCAYNVDYLSRAMTRFGFGERWAYWDAINDRWHGHGKDAVAALFREAAGLINLCGATRLRDEHMECPVRIMIDTDPGFEQIKFAKGDSGARAYLGAHTHFFTYGENIGAPDCSLPSSGLPWRATRPPVIPDFWPEEPGEGGRFTTIATWENKGKNIDFEGESYLWSKHANFLRFLNLPLRSGQAFEMAMLPPGDDVRREVAGKGWALRDPRPVSAGMAAYRDYIRASRGEFTVAKDIYVRPNTGWFSDRSVCYLAAGRPVVTMKTGFSKFYPVGKGLFEFETIEEALAAVDAVNGDYPLHRHAARALAAEAFGSDAVLGRLLSDVGLR